MRIPYYIVLCLVIICGCAQKVPPERIYIKELFRGHWEGQSISVAENRNSERKLSPVPARSRVKNYGRIQFLLNSDDTYRLDVSITRDICGRDTQGRPDDGRVLVHAGFQLLSTGHCTYVDSIVEFYNYHNQRELKGIIYTYDTNLYLSCVDRQHHTWEIEFVRID